jgi:hypothetical protein
VAARLGWWLGAALLAAMGLAGLVRTAQLWLAGGGGPSGSGMGALFSVGLLGLAARAARRAQPPLSSRRPPSKR